MYKTGLLISYPLSIRNSTMPKATSFLAINDIKVGDAISCFQKNGQIAQYEVINKNDRSSYLPIVFNVQEIHENLVIVRYVDTSFSNRESYDIDIIDLMKITTRKSVTLKTVANGILKWKTYKFVKYTPRIWSLQDETGA